jgi:hypothetical protein
MMSRRFAILPLLAAAWVVALVTLGCGRKGMSVLAFLNQRPSVTLGASPVGSPDTAWYAYDIHWTGADPDGQVDHYQYAIDPPPAAGADTVWVSTTATGQRVFFRATEVAYDPVHGWRANGFHTFAIRAFDDRGAISPVVSQAFFAYTIAPKVWITSPLPNPLLSAAVPSRVQIRWAGVDEDGVRSQSPVLYKYRLFRQGDPEFDLGLARQFPDSLRRFYAERAFAGWDSVGPDSTSVTYSNLAPGTPYLFAIIAIDEAGAYSPDFSLSANMLTMIPQPGATGPAFRFWNEFFSYDAPFGGVFTDPGHWVNLEFPAGQPVTVHWIAIPVAGSTIAWYRWRLDGDISDEAPRVDEVTDWYHWSRKSPTTTSATIGPFPGASEHFLYVEAMDDQNQASLGIIHFRAIAPTFVSDLLVLDDTRLAPDRIGANGVPMRYPSEWPAAAELDTFLYARGGSPWRGPQGITGSLPLSKPGVFAGYSYDTLGTRQGYEIASSGVPLSLLGRYRHLLWLTDVRGATTVNGPTAVIDPVSTLRWMSERGRSSALSAYAYGGGQVWLAGGTGAYCTQGYLDTMNHADNNNLYGPGKTVFSASAGELVPGTFMYDFAHWRSELTNQLALTIPTRSPAAVGGWTQPGWNYSGTVTAPDYSHLPVQLRRRALALGDSLPPTRAGQANYYYANSTIPVEYLDLPNVIVEDVDPNPMVEDQRSVLDTLMELRGGALSTLFTGCTPVAMTYYHGVERPQCIFSGFDLWSFSRQDVVALVDLVLHDIWGLDRAPVAPSGARARAAIGPAVGAPARAPATRLPDGEARRR